MMEVGKLSPVSADSLAEKDFEFEPIPAWIDRFFPYEADQVRTLFQEANEDDWDGIWELTAAKSLELWNSVLF